MLRRLGFLVLAALVAGFAVQQGGSGAGTCGGACSESCPGDAAPHTCPPGCTACVCVGFAVALSGDGLTAEPSRLVVARVDRLEGPAPADPPPDAIFHVPRSIAG